MWLRYVCILFKFNAYWVDICVLNVIILPRVVNIDKRAQQKQRLATSILVCHTWWFEHVNVARQTSLHSYYLDMHTYYNSFSIHQPIIGLRIQTRGFKKYSIYISTAEKSFVWPPHKKKVAKRFPHKNSDCHPKAIGHVCRARWRELNIQKKQHIVEIVCISTATSLTSPFGRVIRMCYGLWI